MKYVQLITRIINIVISYHLSAFTFKLIVVQCILSTLNKFYRPPWSEQFIIIIITKERLQLNIDYYYYFQWLCIRYKCKI